MTTAIRKASFNDADVVCWWCKQSCPNTPYRSPVPNIAGARFVVCGPLCPSKPADAAVITDWKRS